MKQMIRPPQRRGDAFPESIQRLVLTGLSLLLLTAACTASPQETGVLEGYVTIGPLVPASREGVPDPTPAPEVYAAREIVIFAEDGQTEMARAQISPDEDYRGRYRVTLPVGTYVVDINRIGVDRGMDLPTMVEIVADQVTRLDIDIDTGIR